jgi:hypothetical protein
MNENFTNIFCKFYARMQALLKTFLSIGYLLMFLSLIGENLQIAEK